MKIGGSPNIGRVAEEGKPSPKGATSEQKTTDSFRSPPGRLMRGTVLSYASDGQTLLSVAGTKLAAESVVPLKVGQDLWFEVVRDGSPPVVAPAGTKGAVGELLRLLSSLNVGRLPAEGSVAQAMLPGAFGFGGQALPSSLESFFQLFVEGTVGAEPDVAKLLKSSLALGLFDKSKDASGKSGTTAQKLFDFIHSLSQKGGVYSVSTTEEGKGVVRLLKLFEAFAQLNTQAVGSDQPEFLLFPCFFSGESGWGEWLFSFDKEEGANEDSGKAYGLSFFLDLSNLGELHLQVSLKGQALTGVFSVHDDAVSRHVSENFEELSSALSNLGFHPVNLSCQVSNKANLHRLKEELSSRAGTDSFSLVDVTI